MAGFGVSFLPTGDGQSGATRDRSGSNLTPSNISPLNTAWNVLSLRLPKFLGAGSLAPQELMGAPGAAGAAGSAPPSLMGGGGGPSFAGGESGLGGGEGPSGFNPDAALFEAAIKALLGQGGDPLVGAPGMGGGGYSGLPGSVDTPAIHPGTEDPNRGGVIGPAVGDWDTPPPTATPAPVAPPSGTEYWMKPGKPGWRPSDYGAGTISYY